MSCVPAISIRGDVPAQELDARLTASQTPVGRMGVEAFWHPARRDLIMQLPTTSGSAVLEAFEAGSRSLMTMPEEQREAFLHALLEGLVESRWNVDCRRLWFAAAPSEPFPETVLLKAPSEISAWYALTYENQHKRDADIAKKKADGARFPGREWRAGRAQENSDRLLYPAKTSAPIPPHGQRAKVPSAVRPGELWAHPGDVGCLWPGVSASHRMNPVPPTLTGGEDMEHSDYRFVPLARRADLDRVLNTLLEFPSMFKKVKVTGEGGFAYKKYPWSHMNPYHIDCQIKLPEVASYRAAPRRKQVERMSSSRAPRGHLANSSWAARRQLAACLRAARELLASCPRVARDLPSVQLAFAVGELLVRCRNGPASRWASQTSGCPNTRR